MPRVARTIRVRNNGPIPAQINWQLREGDEDEPIVKVKIEMEGGGMGKMPKLSLNVKGHVSKQFPFNVKSFKIPVTNFRRTFKSSMYSFF